MKFLHCLFSFTQVHLVSDAEYQNTINMDQGKSLQSTKTCPDMHICVNVFCKSGRACFVWCHMLDHLVLTLTQVREKTQSNNHPQGKSEQSQEFWKPERQGVKFSEWVVVSGLPCEVSTLTMAIIAYKQSFIWSRKMAFGLRFIHLFSVSASSWAQVTGEGWSLSQLS